MTSKCRAGDDDMYDSKLGGFGCKKSIGAIGGAMGLNWVAFLGKRGRVKTRFNYIINVLV